MHICTLTRASLGRLEGGACGALSRASLGRLLEIDEATQPPSTGSFSANWLPTVHLDKDGKRIDPKKLKKRIIKAVPEAKREQVEAVFERIEDEPQVGPDPVVLDRMAADLQAIALFLPEIQVNLITQMRQIAYEIEERAEDERDIELLLLAM